MNQVPRRKPTETVVHRVELGTWERDHLGPLAGALTAKPFVQAFTDIIRDNSALLVIAGFLTLLLPNWLPPGWREELGIGEPDGGLGAVIRDWLEVQNLAGGLVGAWGGGVAGSVIPGFGTIVGAVLGFFTGLVAVEAGEDIAAELSDLGEEANRGVALAGVAVLLSVISILERVGNRDN